MRCKVFQRTEISGVFWFNRPRWILDDGHTLYVCEDWNDAMRKARRRLRGQAA